MRRVAIVLVVVLLLLLLIAPVGMGAGMHGMPCPDCALTTAPITCLMLVLGLATILFAGSSWRRVALAAPIPSGENQARIPERPPK